MIATPGTLRQFVNLEHKATKFCWRKIARSTVAAVKLRLSKSAADHDQAAESVEEFLTGGYHDAQRN